MGLKVSESGYIIPDLGKINYKLYNPNQIMIGGPNGLFLDVPIRWQPRIDSIGYARLFWQRGPRNGWVHAVR